MAGTDSVRSFGIAIGVSLGLIGGCAFAAPERASTVDVRTLITWDPSVRVWADSLSPQRCSARMVPVAGEPQTRAAAYARSGELVAEFRTPQLTPVAEAGARACAAEAADAAGAPALLSAAEAPFQAFRGAFAACLVRQGSAAQLGGLRLWIDTRCDW